jgi:hypothetical protein
MVQKKTDCFSTHFYQRQLQKEREKEKKQCKEQTFLVPVVYADALCVHLIQRLSTLLWLMQSGYEEDS